MEKWALGIQKAKSLKQGKIERKLLVLTAKLLLTEVSISAKVYDLE